VIPHLPLECSCALLPGPAGEYTRSKMDELAAEYDEAVKALINKWNGEKDAKFGVRWYVPYPSFPLSTVFISVGISLYSNPTFTSVHTTARSRSKTDRRQSGKAIDLENWPIEALSPVDCFHPSEKAHQRVAAGFWNRMTLSSVSLLYLPFHRGFDSVEGKRSPDSLGRGDSGPVSRVKRSYQPRGVTITTKVNPT
jgi:phospholipase B1